MSGDDGAHSTNEKLDLSNYVSGSSHLENKTLTLGIKLLGSYLHEIAVIKTD